MSTIGEGIQFPPVNKGQPSSTTTGKAIVAIALESSNLKAAEAVRRERQWRKQYPVHFRALVESGIRSPKAAINIAKSGLAEACKQFVFIRNRQQYALPEAMRTFQTPAFKTIELHGAGSPVVAEWVVPYRGEMLYGDRLRQQIGLWERDGIVEPSHADALRRVLDHPEWLDLSDRTMVLFGAASEAGPLTWLAQWRANIVAIDLPNPVVWEKIVKTIQRGNAKLFFPVPIDTEDKLSTKVSDLVKIAGANLLTQTPEIATWLKGFDQPLDLAAIAYLDGERHVRVSMAMDAVMSEVSRAKSDSSLMYMLTPTDIYAINAETANEARDRFGKRPFVRRVLTDAIHVALLKNFFVPNTDALIRSENGKSYGVADCLVIEQGPNYALAKRLQQWRATLARHEGQRVCLNVAPSTMTHSVIKNPILKSAFDGADLFQVEAFEPATTNAIMAAIWVHDLRCVESAANPANPLDHPLELISESANHGGLWRVPYLARSALPFSAVYGWVKEKARL
ncbi:hypothetical protein [Aquirhabdus parva]|uniref:Uncharacterized protein n=1 Tax=Aquirhabdus parva TaxID=2283318 RepID=A0A345P9X0_9GAMM|nr:hypothetical protein [Aquirhabdus parva]AXI04079.1 hypothetical protein HYN46_15270 [Aquirhabdus parva]